jgi:hypothetical protein
MRVLKCLAFSLAVFTLLASTAEAAHHAPKHSKKFDYRYKPPKLKYKAPKFHSHKLRHS